ncbi:hypothetical protein [Staphylococcus epidermidis]|uniref:hypothetical protein n=1 Tax=Staphylococcus epidermidis TaxID=1282 RepID=UPI00352D5C8B
MLLVDSNKDKMIDNLQYNKLKECVLNQLFYMIENNIDYNLEQVNDISKKIIDIRNNENLDLLLELSLDFGWEMLSNEER